MERYRVADLEVDADAALVVRAGSHIPLPPLSFNLLLALVRRAPLVVRRQQLLETVWPGEFVGDETLSQRVRLLRLALGDESGAARYVGSARGWGYRIVAAVNRVEAADEPIRALAVLPLVNLSGEAEQDYYADGLTDALITSLAKLRAVKVISRTSAMCYRATDKRLPQIAGELGVQAVVEGSVLRTGRRVRVSAQLMRAATDQHIWADTYERDASEMPTLVNDLAAIIAREIRVAVSAEERIRFEGRRAVDAMAHEAHLRGRYCLAGWSPSNLDRAIACFEEAVERDPSCAEALAGLGFANLIRAVPFGSDLSASAQAQMAASSKAAIARALRLDGALATAHMTSGMVSLFFDWNWNAAEQALRRAIDLDPNYSEAHFYRALLASTALDREMVHREADRAIELDPLNLTLRSEYAEICFWVREYDQAIGVALDTLAFDPAYVRPHFILGRVYEAQGRIREAIAEYEKAQMITPAAAVSARESFDRDGAPGFHGWARRSGLSGHGATGGTEPRPIRPFWRAKLAAQAGDTEQALACLELAYEEHECLLVLLRAQEWWDGLRSDPRFANLVRRVGVPDTPEAAG